jgi:hypothetical protein
MSLQETNFMGRDGFWWAQGVVEDRIDPLKLGRVRVRALGWHTETKTFIPTEELHWAYVAMPVTSASMSGLGQSPTGLVPGTWVMLFFRDGQSAQDPLVMFSFGGIPEEAANKTVGFYDPRDNPALDEQLATAPRKIQTRSYPNDGSGAQLTNESSAQPYPRVVQPLGCVLDEPDTNRLARNENIADTIVQVKTDQRDLGIPVALDADDAWDEPITPYNAQYPFNHVYESESGHITEFDDTPNNERTHRYHRTGTFEEIGPDGSKVVKVVMDNYEVILRDNLCHIQGVCDVTINGNANVYVGHDLNVEVNNDATIVVKGNLKATTFGTAEITTVGDVSIWNQSDCDITTEGDLSLLTKGTTSIQTEGDTLVLSKGDTNIETYGDALIYTEGECDVTTVGNLVVQSLGNVSFAVAGTFGVKCGGPMTLTSGGPMTLTAPVINLNPTI